MLTLEEMLGEILSNYKHNRRSKWIRRLPFVLAGIDQIKSEWEIVGNQIRFFVDGGRYFKVRIGKQSAIIIDEWYPCSQGQPTAGCVARIESMSDAIWLQEDPETYILECGATVPYLDPDQKRSQALANKMAKRFSSI